MLAPVADRAGERRPKQAGAGVWVLTRRNFTPAARIYASGGERADEGFC